MVEETIKRLNMGSGDSEVKSARILMVKNHLEERLLDQA